MTSLMRTYPDPPATFVRGEGIWLFDADGRRYLDGISGLAVTSLGHAHPVVAEAVAEQARTLSHVSNLYGNELAPEVAATLDRLIGGGEQAAGGQVFFCNSGAEANECALKLARRWAGPGRHVVVSAWGSFHGRTLATLAATGQPAKHAPFEPLPGGFVHVPYDDLDALAAALDGTGPGTTAGVGQGPHASEEAGVGAPAGRTGTTAGMGQGPHASEEAGVGAPAGRNSIAVLLEPLQGEGGVVVPSSDYLAGVRALCTERGALLMLDEVQTGLGRTGHWFAFHATHLQPDVVTMAKALGNGMPVGACWARAEVAAAFGLGDHATTFGGQPLALSAARATLRVMEEEDVCGRARRAGARLAAGLEGLPGVRAVRGAGLLLAAELVEAAAPDVVTAALGRGLLVNAVRPDAVRLAPSLLISDQEVDEAVERLSAALGAVLGAEAVR